MSNCITLTDQGRIEVRLSRDGDCNLCPSRDEPKDVREVALFNKHGLNIITLGFCHRHRLDLIMALVAGQQMEVPNVSEK